MNEYLLRLTLRSFHSSVINLTVIYSQYLINVCGMLNFKVLKAVFYCTKHNGAIGFNLTDNINDHT